jgi:hypothetical protein
VLTVGLPDQPVPVTRELTIARGLRHPSGNRSWAFDTRSWAFDTRSWAFDTRSWAFDTRSWAFDTRS